MPSHQVLNRENSLEEKKKGEYGEMRTDTAPTKADMWGLYSAAIVKATKQRSQQ